MLKNTILFFVLFFQIAFATAQINEENGKDLKGITVWLSSDTVSLGSYIELKFTIHNLKGKFTGPDFREFDLLSGPNLSQSISIINGIQTSTESYSYILQPKTSGHIKIESFVYESDSNPLIIDEINILSLEEKVSVREQQKSKKGITLYYSADQRSAQPKKKKITHYKKRRV